MTSGSDRARMADILRRMVEAYQVGDDAINDHLGHLRGQNRFARWSWATGWLGGRLMAFAQDHAAECADDGCLTCAHIRDMLAMHAALDRDTTEREFRRMMAKNDLDDAEPSGP